MPAARPRIRVAAWTLPGLSAPAFAAGASADTGAPLWLLLGIGACALAALAWGLQQHRRLLRRAEELDEERQRLQVLIDTLPDLVWLKGLDGRYLFGNLSLKQTLGAEGQRLVGLRDTDMVDAETAAEFARGDELALASDGPHRQELWQQFPASGRRGLFETLKTALRDRQGQVIGVLGISRDITAQREAATHLRRLNRLYRVLSRVQEAIVRQPGREALFAQVCEVLVEDDDLRLAWIGVPDARAEHLLPVARAGQARAYLDGLALPLAPDTRLRDPARTAWLEARSDAARDRPDRPQEWDATARTHGLIAQASFPLVQGDAVCAVLSVHSHQADFFNAAEISLIERLVAQLSLALEAETSASERRDALLALQHSEARFASLFRFSPVGMALRRMSDGCLIDANRAWLELFGLRREQALGRAETALAQWPDTALADQVRHALDTQGHVDGIEVTLQRGDGSRIEVSYAATRIELADEAHLLSAYQDTSLYHQAARALQQQAESLEREVASRTAELGLIFQALPDVYFRIARDGTILDYRAGRQADLFQPRQQLLGRRMAELLPVEASARFGEGVEQVLRGQAVEVFEYALVTASGPQHLEARLLPLAASELVVVVRNVTDRRAMETARAEALREGERLATLRNQFIANMSHEIHTPLNGVLGMAQLGLSRAEDPRQRETFQHILDSGRWLFDIVSDVLDISQLEERRLSVAAVPVSLPELVREVMAPLQGEAQARGLTLASAEAPELKGVCLGDPERLRQILRNLLANAMKFTDRGGVRVELTQDSAHWRLSVSDTGVGIEASVQAALFQPFLQADPSSTRRHGGTGLGLAISQRLARLMGGDITVQSQPGVGSCFTLTLPVHEADTLPSPPPPASPTATCRLSGLRLLVAEDNPVNQEVIATMLRSEGAEVTLAADGEQALRCVQTRGAAAFDLVLMDLQMPVMDGFEAARQLLADAPELPIIAQTAHAFAEERLRSTDAGMIDHITKPIDLDRLVRSVQRHARPRGPEDTPAR